MNAKTIQISRDRRKLYNAHLSLPPQRRGPGLLILHEIHGLNEDIRNVANEYARAGYVTVAPNLFWRRRGHSAFAYADVIRAQEALEDLGAEDALLPEIAKAFEAFKAIPEFDGSTISILGFGLGGALALKAACFDWVRPNAAISFYGARPDLLPLAPALRPAWQFHFAEHDRWNEADIYQASVLAFRGRTDIEIISYPDVLDGFALPGKVEYQAEAAQLAHQRALSFLTKSRRTTRAA